MPTEGSLEKGRALEPSARPMLPVTQPEKLRSMLEVVGTMGRVTEAVTEVSSAYAGGASGAQTGGTQATLSDRARAIANLPAAPIMQRELEKHIKQEIKVLRKQVRRISSRPGRPGAAHKLNQLYAQIRRLNGLLSDLLDASYEILKRLFIRIFVDKQTVF